MTILTCCRCKTKNQDKFKKTRTAVRKSTHNSTYCDDCQHAYTKSGNKLTHSGINKQIRRGFDQ